MNNIESNPNPLADLAILINNRQKISKNSKRFSVLGLDRSNKIQEELEKNVQKIKKKARNSLMNLQITDLTSLMQSNINRKN